MAVEVWEEKSLDAIDDLQEVACSSSIVMDAIVLKKTEGAWPAVFMVDPGPDCACPTSLLAPVATCLLSYVSRAVPR